MDIAYGYSRARPRKAYVLSCLHGRSCIRGIMRNSLTPSLTLTTSYRCAPLKLAAMSLLTFRFRR